MIRPRDNDLDLTLAIPVLNDLPHLLRLLARVARLGLARHVVVVDDGSDVAIDKSALLDVAGLAPDRLTLLRHDMARGPGMARNLALAHAPGDHLLFLDADDLPTPELLDLRRDLAGQTFDFCLFQHHDTRMERDGLWGQMPHDHALWRATGADLGALCPLSGPGAATLSGTANYPWNKIYRTGFLRDNAIGCSDILVHEDIELHWNSFLEARQILTSDRIGVIHFVSADGGRLTNLLGPERLQVFGPLERIATRIDQHRADRFALPFYRFAFGLIDWISDNLAPDLQDRFAGLTRDFLQTHLNPVLQAEITRQSPALLDRVQHILSRV